VADVELSLVLDEEPAEVDIEALEQGLDEHALPITGSRGFVPIAYYLRDSQGRTRGGVLAKLNWNWLFIDTLWVDKSLRSQGEGSRLLEAIEDYGRRQGCESVHLDTFSFQARPFYESHGYEVFATLDDYPTGHSRYYLRKRLSESSQFL
jgi:GNAT superfamily N-acetyltransferase